MADDDTATLLVQLEARITNFEKAMNRASSIADKQFGAVEKRTADFNTRFNRSLASAGRGGINQLSTALSGLGKAAALLGAGATLASLQRLADTATTIQNSLKVTGLSGADLTKVYDALFASAQKNAMPMETLVQLYSRASTAAKDLGANQDDLLKFTDRVAVSLKVSGQSAEQSAGALLQLGQALGDGTVQAQEYNSLLDGAQPLLRAVAAGMTEAGGSVSKLTALVKDGKVSSEAFFRAFLAGSGQLDAEVASSQETIGQSFQKIGNSLVNIVGEFDQSTGASDRFAGGMDGVAAAIDRIDVAGMIAKLEAGKKELDGFFADVGNSDFFKWLNGNLTPDQLKAHGLTPINHNSPVDMDFAQLGATTQDSALADALARRAAGGNAPVKPISLADYPVTGKGGKGGAGGSADANAVKNTTDSLQRQLDALTQTDREQQIANELAEAHVAASSKDGQAVAALTGKLYDQRQALDASNQAAGFLADTLEGAFEGILDGSKSVTDALADIAKSLAENVLQAELLGQGPLAGILGTTPATSGAPAGILGTLASTLLSGIKFAGGGHVTGPGTSSSDSIPAMLSNGEFVVRASAAAQHRRLLEAINSGRVGHYAEGGSIGSAPSIRALGGPSNVVTLAPSITVNATGGTPAANDDLAARVSKAVEGSMRNIAAEEILKSQRPGNMGYRRNTR